MSFCAFSLRACQEKLIVLARYAVFFLLGYGFNAKVILP
jgi:hypothetical protein